MAVNVSEEVVALLHDPTLENYLFGAIRKIFPATPNSNQTLAQMILAQAVDYHSNRTGGVLHAVTPAQADQMAALIEEFASESNLSQALVLAGMKNESRCDPLAENPNNQDAKPGETPAQALLHLDVGCGQFDVTTMLNGSPPFEECKGLTPEMAILKAKDPVWAVATFCRYVRKLIDDARAETNVYPALLQEVPQNSVLVLALEAYNAGETGARLIAQKNGVKGDWSYGLRWLADFHLYQASLGGPLDF